LTPPLIFEWLERQGNDSTASRAAVHRDSIKALVPQLVEAQRAGNRTAYHQLADRAVRYGDSLVAVYRVSMPSRPLVARLVDMTVNEFMGRGHGIEEALGALFGGGSTR
jgi:hypothetical protein